MNKLSSIASSILVGLAASTSHAAIGHNGVQQNAAFQNAAFQNAAFQNAAFQNAAFQNGAFQNGAFQNAAFQNAAFQNAAFQNAAFQNGAFQNGAFQNAAFQNAAFQNGELITATFANGVFPNEVVSQPPFADGVFLSDAMLAGTALEGLGVPNVDPSLFTPPPAGPGFSLSGVINPDGRSSQAMMSGSQIELFESDTWTFHSGTSVIGSSFAYYTDPSVTRPLLVAIKDAMVDSNTNTMAAAANADNSDVWLYRLVVPVVFFDLVDDGEGGQHLEAVSYSEVPVCGDGDADTSDEWGMMLDSSADATGAVVYGGAVSTTYSCARGTMAKAARAFGYKPWKSYTELMSDNNPQGYANLAWAAAFNATSANYCGDVGNSYTVTGTLIDMEDRWGLNVKTAENDIFAFAPESEWSANNSGTLAQLYVARQEILSQSQSVMCGETEVPFVMWANDSMSNDLRVHTSQLCSHPPAVEGAALFPTCNPCTRAIAEAGPYSDCNWLAWDATCVALAEQMCGQTVEQSEETGFTSGYGNMSL